MKTKKLITSLLLCATLFTGVFPSTANAAPKSTIHNNTESKETAKSFDIVNIPSTTLSEITSKSFNSNGNIKLLLNVSYMLYILGQTEYCSIEVQQQISSNEWTTIRSSFEFLTEPFKKYDFIYNYSVPKGTYRIKITGKIAITVTGQVVGY